MIRQRILRAAISSGAVRLISLSVNLFLTPFILHTLGDTQYGLFVIISSLATQASILDLGISPAVMRYVAELNARQNYDSGRGVIATALSLYSLIGLVVLMLAGVIAAFFPYFFNVPPPLHAAAIIAAFLMGIQVAISIPNAISGAILWGLHRYEYVQAIAIFATLLSAASTVAVLLAGGGIVALFATSILAALVPQVIAIWLVRYLAPKLRLGWQGARRDLVGKLLLDSVSSFVIQAGSTVQTQIDEILIGIFLPISNVGGYYVARRLSALPQALAQPVLGSFIPLASELHAQDDNDRLRKLYLIGTRAILAICIPLFLAITVLAGPLLTLWVGAKYATTSAVALVFVLAVASVLEVGYWPGRMILQGISRHHGLTKATICAAIAKLGLSLFLIRHLGVMGVALGTLIPSVVVHVSYIWPHTMRIIQVSGVQLLKHTLLPVFVPALPMMAVLYALARTLEPSRLIPVGATAAAGLTIYAIVYLIFFAGELERQLVHKVISRLSATLLPRSSRP